MCRSIKTLRTNAGPATDDEIHAAALQFVRKLSGFRQPSKANAEAFDAAVDDIARAAKNMLDALPPGKAAPSKPRVRDYSYREGAQRST